MIGPERRHVRISIPRQCYPIIYARTIEIELLDTRTGVVSVLYYCVNRDSAPLLKPNESIPDALHGNGDFKRIRGQ